MLVFLYFELLTFNKGIVILLRHITVISTDGITLYHRSYVSNELDDVLFSALSGAIIAFSKELGDELQSIIMRKQMIYFKNIGENIVIFSFTTNYDIDFRKLEAKLDVVIKSKALQTVSDMGISQFSNKALDDELLTYFEVEEDFRRIYDNDDILSIDELTGDAFLDALSKLDNI